MIKESVAQESADEVRAQAITVGGFEFGTPVEELQMGRLSLHREAIEGAPAMGHGRACVRW